VDQGVLGQRSWLESGPGDREGRICAYGEAAGMLVDHAYEFQGFQVGDGMVGAAQVKHQGRKYNLRMTGLSRTGRIMAAWEEVWWS